MFACVVRARCGVLFRKSRCAEYRYGASQDASSATPRRSLRIFQHCRKNPALHLRLLQYLRNNFPSHHGKRCLNIKICHKAFSVGALSLQGPVNIQQVPICHEYMYVFTAYSALVFEGHRSSSRSQFDEGHWPLRSRPLICTWWAAP